MSCEVDEVRGLSVFTGRRPGLIEAKLVFRTGCVDETVPRRGLTHLIEHLACGPMTPADGVNGQVLHTVTAFTVEGSDSHVVDWLQRIAGRLVDLPVERLQVERRILDVEEQNEGFSAARQLLFMHYGYQGPGLAASREFGLRRLEPAELRQRAARCFGVTNAALALSRPVEGFDGLGLPVGERQLAPTAVALARAPGAAELSSEGARVAFGAPVADAPASVVLASIIQRRAWQTIRYERGLLYEIGIRGFRVGANERFLLIATDALDKDAQAVAEALTQLIDELADSPVADRVLAAGICDIERRLHVSGGVAGAAMSSLILERPRLPAECSRR